MPNKPKIYNFAWQLRVLPSFARFAPLHRDFLCRRALKARNSSFVLGQQPWSWWFFPPLSLGHGWSQELSNVNLWQRKVDVSSPCNVFLEIYLRHKSTYKHNMHDIMIDFRLLYKKTITNTLRNWRGLCKTRQALTFLTEHRNRQNTMNKYWWYKQLCLRLLW